MDFDFDQATEDLAASARKLGDDFVGKAESEHPELWGPDAERISLQEDCTFIPEVLDIRQRFRLAAKEAGFYGASNPPQVGGLGLGKVATVKLAYELSSGPPPPPVIWGGMYNYITGGPWGAVPVLLRGSPYIRERYFDRLMTAKYSTCIALTDPGAGSDPQNMKTTAMRDGDNWVINGHKRFVGNSPYADFLMVYARTSGSPGDHRGISMIMVDKDSPGFRMLKVNRVMEGLGNHGELLFEDCVVPAENLVGEEGGGFSLALEDVSLGRLIVGAKCLGIADWILDQAVQRAKEHRTFGVALAERQAIQWMLAEASTQNELLRNLLFSTAWKLDQGKPARREVSMVKLVGPRAYSKSADVAMQIFGGLGYLDDYPFSRAFRQSRGLRIIEGSDEMQLRAIALSLLKG